MKGQLRALLAFKLKKRQLAAIREKLACHVLIIQGDQVRVSVTECVSDFLCV